MADASTARDFVGLYIKTGEHVVSVEIPKFVTPPEVVKWGSRHFVRIGNQSTGLKYVEAFCYEAATWTTYEQKEGDD